MTAPPASVQDSAMNRVTSFIVLLVLGCRSLPMPQPTISSALEARFAAWEAAGPTGDAAHRARLHTLVATLKTEQKRSGRLELVFVCTHNSRRSHMGQLLAAAAARRAGVQARTYSAGTEATAFNPRAAAALSRAGFEVAWSGEGPNPHAQVRWAQGEPPADVFSKTLDDPSLPPSGFVAIMTCSQADAACPLVKGAAARVSLPYEDPKVADGTPEEAQRYDERVEQVGRDLAWVFRQLAG
jgi:arsenate reductase